MKFNRTLMFVTLFIVLGAASITASDVFDWVKAKRVTVTVNQSEAESKGLLWDTRTDTKHMVPIKELANQLQAIVQVDPATDEIKIIKPNVHMMLVVDKDKIEKGSKVKFNVLLQVDSLESAIHSHKFTLVDPSGKETELLRGSVNEKADDVWSYRTEFVNDFKSAGKYKVNYYMRLSGDDPYTLVSQKAIIVK